MQKKELLFTAVSFAALACASPAALDSDAYVNTDLSFELIIALDPEDETLVFNEGLGYAFSLAFSTAERPVSPCGYGYSTCEKGYSDAFYGYGVAEASTVSDVECNNTFAEARLSEKLLELRTHLQVGFGTYASECGESTTWSGATLAGVKTTISGPYAINISIDAVSNCSNSVTSKTIPGGIWIDYIAPDGVRTLSVFGFDCLPGLQPNCGTGSYATQISGIAGVLNLGYIPISTLGYWDYNSDGRVNQLDLNALNSLVPFTYTDPDPVSYFDFDNDNDVDADDILIIEQIFSSFDQGVLGDDNGDWVTDCNDLAGVLAHQFDPTLTICDLDYRIEFDSDIDGDNDLEDRAELLRIIQPGDVNLDGFVDFLDTSAFLTAFGNPCP